MMPEKYINFILAIAIVLLTAGIFYPDEDNSEDQFLIKNDPKTALKDNNLSIKIEYEHTEEKKSVVSVKEKIPNEEFRDINENLITEEKPVKLYSTKDYSGRYTLELLSDKKINIEKEIIDFITVSGEIEKKEGKNNITRFVLSINKNYLNRQNNLTLQLKDIVKKDNLPLKCDDYFLGYLEYGMTYYIKIDIFDDYLSCYIQSQKKLVKLNSEVKNSKLINIDEIKNSAHLEMKDLIF